MFAPEHPHEARRLKSLQDHRILDSAPDEAFDALVRLAALCLDAPYAAINFVDEHRVWTKSFVGFASAHISRDASVCAHAILAADILVIEDMAVDRRSAALSTVTGPPHLRFYAGAPVRDSAGLPLGTLCVFDHAERGFTDTQRDILIGLTDQVSALLQLLRRENRRRDFVATLAHELRNPLAPMRTVVEVLRRNGSQDELSNWGREVIERQIDHIARLTDDLLDVSVAVEGRLNLKKAKMSLADVAQRAYDTVQPALEIKGQRLRMQGARRDAFIEVDAVRMAQVLINLISDASIWAPADTPVELAITTDASSVSFEVSAPRFRTEPIAVNQPHAPIGQGVAITLARRLVELHAGSFQSIPSDPLKETRYLVVLPLQADSTAPPPVERIAPDAAYTRRPRRVLVIDDNSDQAESLGMLIGIWGHEVRIACDGIGALAAADEFGPDTVLCDITLPGMDGYEIARRLIASGRPMTLAALTGHGSVTDQRKSEEAGFRYHLTKPVDMALLHRLLEDSGPFASAQR